MKQKNPLVVFVALALLGIGVFAFLYSSGEKADEAPVVDGEALVSQEEVQLGDGEVIAVVDIDIDKALSERILGNPEAPVKISEFSSFTCGHCGRFHKNTYETFKKEWIDKGRAYLVFSDFPLNAPALHASMAARCVPEENYFDFVQQLYMKQDDWAYDTGYMNTLKDMAMSFGLSGDEFKACLNSEELREGIVNRMRAAQSQWEVSSTPSFVINNETTIAGAMDFATFDAAIKEAITPVPDPSPAHTGDVDDVPANEEAEETTP